MKRRRNQAVKIAEKYKNLLFEFCEAEFISNPRRKPKNDLFSPAVSQDV